MPGVKEVATKNFTLDKILYKVTLTVHNNSC